MSMTSRTFIYWYTCICMHSTYTIGIAALFVKENIGNNINMLLVMYDVSTQWNTMLPLNKIAQIIPKSKKAVRKRGRSSHIHMVYKKYIYIHAPFCMLSLKDT